MLRTLFSPTLLAFFAIIIGYTIGMVWWLQRVGYWDTTMLYDTVVFIVIGGIGSVSRAASRGVTYDGRFFSRTILVNLEVMVVFAFLLDFFPFNFWVEFLLIIPIVTLIVMLVVVAEHQKGAEAVHQFLNGVQSFIGFILIAYILWQIVENYEELMHLRVLFSLGLPFVMSLLFIPVLFFTCTLFAYEDAFQAVSVKGGEDKQLSRWKKQRLFLRFGLNLKALQKFRRSAAIHKYGRTKTKDDALNCLNSWSSTTQANSPG